MNNLEEQIKIVNDWLSPCRTKPMNKKPWKYKVEFEGDDLNGNHYLVIKRRLWKRYVVFLGLLPGQTHSPLWFEKKKDIFLHAGHDPEWVFKRYEIVCKYVELGGCISDGVCDTEVYLKAESYIDDERIKK